jgi:hypothetical protein
VGLFDFLKRDRGDQSVDDGKPKDRKLASLGKKASEKRSQSYDRDEAIRALIDIGTPGAAEALLKRFKLNVDPSITDQEEKQLAFDGIVSIGKGMRGKRVSDAGKDPKEISDEPLTEAEVTELREAVIAATRAHCQRAENYTWPLKAMRALLEDSSYEQELLLLLGDFDTEYTRNVEPKINLLAALEEIHSDEVRLVAEKFLDDVNDTVRFHAVETTFKQASPASLPPLVGMMKNEEAVRIKNKVAEGILRQDWTVPEALRDEFRDALRDAYEYAMTDSGKVKKA